MEEDGENERVGDENGERVKGWREWKQSEKGKEETAER